MPVKELKNGKFEVNGKVYEDEEKANAAYQAYLALRFGLETLESDEEE